LYTHTFIPQGFD